MTEFIDRTKCLSKDKKKKCNFVKFVNPFEIAFNPRLKIETFKKVELIKRDCNGLDIFIATDENETKFLCLRHTNDSFDEE